MTTAHIRSRKVTSYKGKKPVNAKKQSSIIKVLIAAETKIGQTAAQVARHRWRLLDAPSSKVPAAVAAVAYARQPLSKARARASHARAGTRYAAARSEAVARRCGQPSWRSCRGCS
mmetsp:Transcript_20314/g.27351  ORF Transcript_20314/g.27351 Transcript_20314/m.27351 type:complete len:116 (-) Transcript_20314:601-948(-)